MPGGPYLWWLANGATVGQVPVYNATTGRFEVGSAASSRVSIAEYTFADSPITVVDTVDIYRIDATDGVVIVNLPAVASWVGRIWQFYKADGSVNKITLTPDGADTINDEATRDIAFQYTNAPLAAFGTNWMVL